MKGVVLAGGLGTRMQPMTRVLNKHLLDVFDEPMVFFPIRKLAQAGIYDIVLPLGMVLVLVVFQRHWLNALRDFGRQMLGIDALATFVGVLCAVAVAVGFQRWHHVFLPLALGGLLVAGAFRKGVSKSAIHFHRREEKYGLSRSWKCYRDVQLRIFFAF